MSYITKSHEALAKADDIREQLARHVESIEVLQGKLQQAEAEVELHLLLADCAGHLRDINTKNFSESQRLRHQGLRKRLNEAVRVA